MKFFTLVLFFFLAGCGFKSFVISNASYIIANQVGNKIDLNWEQEKKFRKQVDYIFKSELANIQKVKMVLSKIDPLKTNTNLIIKELYPIYESIFKKVIVFLSNHMSNYSNKQISNLFEIAEDENKRIINRSKKDKSDEYIKRFNFFFENANVTQKQLFKKHVSMFQSFNKVRIERRLSGQKKLKSAFNLPVGDEREKAILKILDKSLDKKSFLERSMKLSEFISKLQATLTPKQIKHFRKKQTEIIEWLDAFIKYYKEAEIKAI